MKIFENIIQEVYKELIGCEFVLSIRQKGKYISSITYNEFTRKYVIFDNMGYLYSVYHDTFMDGVKLYDHEDNLISVRNYLDMYYNKG